MQVFIHTDDNVLIEVNPKSKIPRTYKRFSFLMAQLLKKLKIRASTTKEVLLKVVKNPVVNHLPKKCITFGLANRGNVVAYSRGGLCVDYGYYLRVWVSVEETLRINCSAPLLFYSCYCGASSLCYVAHSVAEDAIHSDHNLIARIYEVDECSFHAG